MTKLTELIKQVKELDEKATPGDWYSANECRLDNTRSYPSVYEEYADLRGAKYHPNAEMLLKKDVELIAAYRTACPKLAMACEVMMRALEGVSARGMFIFEAHEALAEVEKIMGEK